jgi:predicted PurR-regulated permease PerM
MTTEAPPDTEPAEAPAAEPPARVEPVVVPRWVQLVLLPCALLALYALARAAGAVLLVFLVAAVIALILNPLVRLVERSRLPHGLCVAAVYLGFFAAAAGTALILVNPISDQVASFQRDVPDLVDSANKSLADLQGTLNDHGIDIRIKKQGQTALETIQKNVLRGSGDVVSFSRDLVQTLVEGAFGLVLVLVISIYMLIYSGGIGRLVRAVMPPGDGTPDDDFPTRAQKAVFSYVRGQLLFSLIMGATAGLALWILGVVGIFPDGRTYALFFGVFFGVMELVPYVGPVLGALPPVVVALVQDPLTAVWVAVLFVALQQLEGHVVAPQVFGNALRINPLLIIFALLFGAETYGIIGAFVALPLAAVARETVVYLRRHLVFEPWGDAATPLAAGSGEPIGLPPPPPCSQCGEPIAPGDEFCRRCGMHLGPASEGARDH